MNGWMKHVKFYLANSGFCTVEANRSDSVFFFSVWLILAINNKSIASLSPVQFSLPNGQATLSLSSHLQDHMCRRLSVEVLAHRIAPNYCLVSVVSCNKPALKLSNESAVC